AYIEPVPEVLEAARAMAARRADALGAAGAPGAGAGADLLAEIERTGREAAAAPADREAWRALYRRARGLQARAHLGMLDAPLLFVKQHPYFAAHIYDDYYTWHPGGGIYVLENPAEDFDRRRVRAVIDAATTPTLGAGVYRDADVSWDARRLVFAYRPAADAMTSLYEIGVDGQGLRRLTRSDQYHDITPCYLPDGRIAFTSTRPRGRVPCFNSGVDTLHTMDADGGHILSVSSNNVTEFDPSILPDGRILYGRWEYVDKTALYMQSLWTMLPDGTNETALFANNLPKPTAVLDARPVPGTDMVVASLTPHNGQAVGAIGMIDPALGKNNLGAVTNFTPEYPIEMDQGLTVGPCDPWPLSKDDVLVSNNAVEAHGIIELIDRFGHRDLVVCDPAISCFAPSPVRARPAPPVVASSRDDGERTGRFVVLDVYQGLTGVKRGEVKRLRVVEETARTSEVPPGGRWWNQAFLISWQGAYVVKNFLGTVPVEADGSACFEVPSGRALYLEALDADGREVQRMRTFVQAVPGVTRSCIGCHEHKMTTPSAAPRVPAALARPPSRPEAESWGSGFVDYPTMIQPILDRHCVRCHGGAEDISGGHDLSGGWTWAFNISYETLLKQNLAGFIRCLNEDTTSSDILPPRKIGSGAAPLGRLLIDGHKGRIPDLARAERDLVMAWMDGNSNYYGTWDYTPHATCNAILAAGGALAAEMKSAGCTRCHAPGHVGNDWVNLRDPECSRLLRAPLAKAEGGLGLAWCRERKATAGLPLVTQS
ncbi:MAG: PD40 domain-containing protein, partial [Planctomycetes bacterium]|nr:PD40 domain-containing protein [Planctomycetota bacterium]